MTERHGCGSDDGRTYWPPDSASPLIQLLAVAEIGEGEPADVLLKPMQVLAVEIRGGRDLDLRVPGDGVAHRRPSAADNEDATAQELRHQGACGVMLRFIRKRFVGSYFAFSAASRE
jgi:hypothetical protein